MPFHSNILNTSSKNAVIKLGIVSLCSTPFLMEIFLLFLWSWMRAGVSVYFSVLLSTNYRCPTVLFLFPPEMNLRSLMLSLHPLYSLTFLNVSLQRLYPYNGPTMPSHSLTSTLFLWYISSISLNQASPLISASISFIPCLSCLFLSYHSLCSTFFVFSMCSLRYLHATITHSTL